ncbi:diacylglycerol/polyprenol kinase family protein [Sphingopyxis sp.]|uniref:diacylglycerol/polyprenol kinase family protein n=1 Tax=Sphingopyxis sp. TaxID=1908224 RepID=UPI003D6D1811
MTGLLSYGFAAGAVLVLLVAIALIRRLGSRFAWHAEVQRKLVHVMVGLFAMGLPFLLSDSGAAVFLVALAVCAMLVLRLSAHFSDLAGAAIHAVQRAGLGDIWLAIAVGFLFLQYGGSYILYGLPLAIITLSDAAAALTGSHYGRTRFPTEDGTKSWEGVIAFVLVGWIVAMTMLLLFSDAPRGHVIVLGLVIASFGAMVEAVSWRGLDNLFVPLAIYFFLQEFLGSSPATLGLVTVLFFAACFAAQAAASWLGLARSTARAFGVGAFIFLSVGDLFGAVIPLVAMAIYLLTRSRLPGSGRHPDLDFLGTLCSAAAIWLFIGQTAGENAIHFYNLAMTGLVLGYLLLALPRRYAVILLPLAWGAVVGLSASGWHTAPPPADFRLIAILSLALVAATTLSLPQFFIRWRPPRVMVLASAVPLAAYAHIAGGA